MSINSPNSHEPSNVNSLEAKRILALTAILLATGTVVGKVLDGCNYKAPFEPQEQSDTTPENR